MARKSGSYKFEKRRRELEKKKKKAEKRARKTGRNGDDDAVEPLEPSPSTELLDWLPADASDEG